jgi:glyoxylase-like metal-dependent hydrolase (beta-lactamase superfamily II)
VPAAGPAPDLAGIDVALVRAPNPGPYTLTGTNTWVVGRDPAWVVDPGPALAAHVGAVAAEAERRGGLGGIALTHRHPDHDEGVGALLHAARPAPVAAAAGDADLRLGDGAAAGPLRALSAPGHAPDHVMFLLGDRAGFTGDAILGEGSVFVSPGPGSLAGYLEALRRLRALPLVLLLPGHGPPVTDPAAKLDEYISHRLDRERRLLAALRAGRRTTDELLDEVWDDAPPELRLPAAITLAAHLDKLDEEGRLPDGVERPALRIPNGVHP